MKHIQRIALYLFFFSINFEVWDLFYPGHIFSISKLTGYFYFLTMVPLFKTFSTNVDLKSILTPLLIFFGLLTLVSLFHIKSTYYNFFDFSIFQNIILFYVLFNHERIDPLILEKGLLSFSLGSVAIAILFMAGIGIEYIGGRVRFIGENSNDTGICTSISMIILFLAVFQNRLKLGKMRFLLLTPIPIMMKLMAETGSRVAAISFILAFTVGVLLFKTKKLRSKILLLSVGAIIFISGWQFLMQVEVLKLRLFQTIQEGDLANRNLIWNELLPLIHSNPIFGVGVTGYEYFAQRTFKELISPHNVILEVLCLTGFVGLGIFLIFLHKVFKISYRKYISGGLLLPLIILIPILGLLASGQLLNAKIGWSIFAYIASPLILNQKMRENNIK